MKIAVISYHTCPYEIFGSGFSGGMNVFLRELLERLSLLDISVDVFTRSLDGHSVSAKNDRLKVYHIGCGLPAVPELSDYLENAGRFSEGVLSFLQEGTELLFSNYWLSAPTALALKGRMGIRTVHMNHTLEKVKEVYSGTVYPSGALRHARLFWEFSIQKFADLLVFPSDRDLEVSVAHYPIVSGKGVVLYPGVSEEFLDTPDLRSEGRRGLGFSEDFFLFLFSGRDERTKNLKGLISAFEKLVFDRVRLIIVGSDRNNYGGNIACLQPQSSESLVPLIDASDCVVIPSYYESFGFFGMEALARGKPVVAARGTFLGDLVTRHDLGAVFDGKDDSSLFRALTSIIERKEEFRERWDEISMRARRFTWERASSRFLRVLNQFS